MEQKTQVHAPEGKQEIFITRQFDLPVNLLFKAYAEADLFAEWMSTQVVAWENKNLGYYRFETKDEAGNTLISANGTIHLTITNQKIIRTFQMENTLFEPQMEFLDFESLSPATSKLSIQIIFRSLALRDQLLKLPFTYGLNMALNRLQTILSKHKIL
ncbi:MAG: SRPBCC domain-containing protein [Cyclobacteriaceae bacterium]|nr:SRPBCC domain-containing protein [Cyclobacteriaceae bacterium]